MRSARTRPWIFVIGGAQRGGAEGQFVRLAARLRKAGKPVECVFLFGGGPLLEDLDRAGVPRSVLRKIQHGSRARRAVSLILAVGRLAVLLLQRRPSVVMAWLTFATWPTLLLAEFLTSAARVAGMRGEVLPSEIRWAAGLFRRAMRRADAVVVNSNALVAEAVAWGAVPDRVTVIPNGIDVPPQQSDLRNGSAVVVANYRPYKGHADLLHALTQCRSNARVRLCGSGEAQRHVEELSVELQVRDRVHFVEQPADVPSELLRAGFAIHPSHTEGLSNAILEEMAAGLPVIAMAVGGNPMLVEPGINGYLLEVGDYSALARTIDELTTDAALRLRLGEGAREKIKQFTWQACIERYLELLEGLEAPHTRDRIFAP
jgi:glycosyltransferase involved in cell wall biosynthesis